jgi:cation diffusion facilitator CzcD-associated flavoprotein CzcO
VVRRRKASRNVVLQAVIGAGAGGLVAARELQREGHKVTVFEQGSKVGGVWVYTDDVEDDDLAGVGPIMLLIGRATP